MWPFDRKQRNCDHEWGDKETITSTYPREIYNEDGEPYIYRSTNEYKKCEKCGKTETIDWEEEKVFLKIERTESVDW